MEGKVATEDKTGLMGAIAIESSFDITAFSLYAE
jgi:hypothetical protein